MSNLFWKKLTTVFSCCPWETGSACSSLLVSATEPPFVLTDKPEWRVGWCLGWTSMALRASGAALTSMVLTCCSGCASRWRWTSRERSKGHRPKLLRQLWILALNRKKWENRLHIFPLYFYPRASSFFLITVLNCLCSFSMSVFCCLFVCFTYLLSLPQVTIYSGWVFPHWKTGDNHYMSSESRFGQSKCMKMEKQGI